MTEIRTKKCRWVASDQPRVLPGEHQADCPGDCAGCEPCPHDHCVICRREHGDDAHPLTCPNCVGTVRDDLEQIVDMHARLRGEAINVGTRGDRTGTVLGGDAMVMLAMTYREQTGLAADGDHSHESEADPVPPLLTLATWEDCYRDHLGHDPAPLASVEEAAGYLDLVLTRIAQAADIPFDDFARDIRQTRGRLEDVLHDGERVETGAPCPKCDRALVKSYGRTEAFDRWTCPNRECGTWYLDHEYRLRVTDDYRANSDRLNAADIAAQYGVTRGSLTGWASKGLVRKRGKDQSGRQLYDVGDVLAQREKTQKGAA